MVFKSKSFYFAIFVLIINLIFIISPITQAGVEVSPGKLTINIKDDLSKENISYKIKVKNPYKEDIKVTTKISNPFELTKNFSRIPDLSWVHVSSESFIVPGKSSRDVEVFIDIPNGKEDNYYNRNWEVWVIFIPKKIGSAGATTLQTQLAVKLLIHTPDSNNIAKSEAPFFVWYFVPFFLLIFYVFVRVFFRFSGKKDSSIFYFKDKKKK